VESSVGLAAGLALAGALPELDFACGLGTLSLLTGDVVAGAPAVRDGWLPVPTEPPTPAGTDFAADGETRARWLDRLARVSALAGGPGRP
jgi:O-succinylbenzoate synthase